MTELLVPWSLVETVRDRAVSAVVSGGDSPRQSC